MKTKISSLVTMLIFVFSPLLFAQYPEMDFPLQVGNRWQYSEVPGHISESKAVKDTLMPNGLIYTEVEGELFSGFFRKDSSKVFVYNSPGNDEAVYYDFSKKAGDTLSSYIYEQDTIVTTVHEEGIHTIFGLQKHYISFLTKSSSSTAYFIKTITDGFGFTSYNGEVLSFGLTGAIINGNQYGTIVSIPEWGEDVIISPGSIFLSNQTITDTILVINSSDQTVYLDSITNRYYPLFYCRIIKGDTEYTFNVSGYEISDSLSVQLNPSDSLTFIIEGVDACPICKSSGNYSVEEYIKDTLVFAFSSNSEQVEKYLFIDSDIPLSIRYENINISSFSLNQNYPNPFNPITTISWQSPVSGHQTLKVYDILGVEVAAIVNEYLEKGSYKIEFDASSLSSGVYFYRIQAGGFIETKKMILMK